MVDIETLVLDFLIAVGGGIVAFLLVAGYQRYLDRWARWPFKVEWKVNPDLLLRGAGSVELVFLNRTSSPVRVDLVFELADGGSLLPETRMAEDPGKPVPGLITAEARRPIVIWLTASVPPTPPIVSLRLTAEPPSWPNAWLKRLPISFGEAR